LKDELYFMEALKSIDESIEFIPAHIMTPQGFFGSQNPVYSVYDVFGEAFKYINIVETGLSADPEMLSKIPELDGINFISNSDCHSPAINRIGREYTVIDINGLSYKNVLSALKNKDKTFTYEFPPTEGKFFLTGHRKDKKGHDGKAVVFSPKYTPENLICPVCSKKLTVGVYEQLINIVKAQKAEDRFFDGKYLRKNFSYLIPLADVVKYALNIKTFTKKTAKICGELISPYGSEIKFWSDFKEKNHKNTDKNIIEAVKKIKNGEFSFFPGYDGEYGVLKIGEIIDKDSIKVV
jgi:uncharacterized protein (TIGR00375 family)